MSGVSDSDKSIKGQSSGPELETRIPAKPLTTLICTMTHETKMKFHQIMKFLGHDTPSDTLTAMVEQYADVICDHSQQEK